MDRGRPPGGVPTAPPGAGGPGAGGSFLGMKINEKKRMQDAVAGHRTGLPGNILRLFAPRAPLPPHKAPNKKPPKLPYTGVAAYLDKFAEPGDAEYEPPAPETRPPEPRLFRSRELPTQARVDIESKAEKDIRLRAERLARVAEAREEGLKSWDPSKDPNVEGDPFKTLFISRLSYDVTERKLRREFEEYGPIKRIRLVHDKNSGKPRGYAFVEYEHKNDMKQAYKVADGRKIEDKRVLVDVERGRSVPGWKPRRLGGGKGGESRAVPRPPKHIKKQFVARLMAAAAAEKERLARGEPAAREERPREERPPAERERGEVEEGERRGERYERRDSRGAGDHRPDRERSDRGRSSDYRSRDRSKSRDRDHRRSSRGDERDYRKRDRSRSRDRYDDSKRRRERDP